MEKLRSWDMSQNQIPFHYNLHYIFLYILFSCESGPWTLQLVCWCCPFLGNAHKPVREASPPWKSNRNESRVDACGFCMHGILSYLLSRYAKIAKRLRSASTSFAVFRWQFNETSIQKSFSRGDQ